MANSYTLRLDVIEDVSSEDTLKRIEDALCKYPRYMIYHEYAKETGKPHFQGIVWADEGHETYKKAMERLFPEWKGTRGCKGQGKRSFAPTKTSNYEIYITKDGDVRLCKGYSTEDIERLRAKSYQPAVKAKAERKNEPTGYQKALAHVKQSVSPADWMNPTEICKALIDYYTKAVKCEPNDFQLKCMTKSIMSSLLYESDPQRYERWKQVRAEQIIGREFIFDNI